MPRIIGPDGHPLLPGAPALFTRRRFLTRALGGAAALGLVAAAGCDEEPEIFPTKGVKVWIAQSVAGTTYGATGTSPRPGVTVAFRAGLQEHVTYEIARDTSNFEGHFEMVASNSPNGDAGFWRFIIENDTPRDRNGDVRVYCQLVAMEGENSQTWKFELVRQPSTTLPPFSATFLIEGKNLFIPWA